VFGAKFLDQGEWMDKDEAGNLRRPVTLERHDGAQQMPRYASNDHESSRENGHWAKRWVDDDGERGEWKRFTHVGLILVHSLPDDDALMVEARRLIDKANEVFNNENHFSDEEDEEYSDEEDEE